MSQVSTAHANYRTYILFSINGYPAVKKIFKSI